MTMSLGSNRSQRAEINMTPMIDVLLVLIIIFMVITPLSPRGLSALVPQAPAPDGGAAEPERGIVVTVLGGGAVRLNQEATDLGGLERRMAALFRNTANGVVFIRGERALDFREVAQVIDLVHGAGVSRVALMTN